MPICKREGFDVLEWNDNNETFHDQEMVFFCETTKRIFRDYEKYFRHIMLINSTIWQCESTGRDYLTYEEALHSERSARKKMEQFKEILRPPALLVIENAKQSAIKTLISMVISFLRHRYFYDEEVTVANSKKPTLYKVIEIIPPPWVNMNEVYSETDLIKYQTDSIKYRLRPVDNTTNEGDIEVPFEKVRRKRLALTKENMRMFLRNNVTRIDGLLCPKPESYKRYVTDRNINYSNVFIGKMPHFTPARIRKPVTADDGKKQSTLNKYLVKNNNEEVVVAGGGGGGGEKTKKSLTSDMKTKSLKEEMGRVRREKQEKSAEQDRLKREKLADQEREKIRVRNEKQEKLAEQGRLKREKLAEQERKKAELMERIDNECTKLLTKNDDLERDDQMLLPIYTKIETLLPTYLIGDAFMLREFMHSFTNLMTGINVFQNNLNFYELTRAFTTREVAGPLSNILLVLLGTLFDLQKEEEEDCSVAYRRNARSDSEQHQCMSEAARCHFFAERHFSFKINELPLDALTLSEVLRLHFLSSGSTVHERTERWRIMYRNGYTSSEDPGLLLRMQNAHILRSLKMYPIYHFPFRDIMRVVRCLMAQILTYSGAINLIEERMEEAAQARLELKTIITAENRRLTAVEVQRRKLSNEYNQQCMNDEIKADPNKKEELTQKLNKKIEELMAQSSHEHRKHEHQLRTLNKALFNFLVYLGMDRAYRKYYVFESIPGIFVEHPPDSMDTCLENPPTNHHVTIDGLANNAYGNFPSSRKDLRAYLLKIYKSNDSKEQNQLPSPSSSSSQENKENQEHRLNGLTNGNQDGSGTTATAAVNGDVVTEMEVDDETEAAIATAGPPTQYQLFMCTGDKLNCIVHDERNRDRQRWAYLYEKKDIDALIDSLNPYGFRESELRQQLQSLRSLIEQHVAQCPVDVLSLDDNKKIQKFKNIMAAETHRKYNKANFGLYNASDLNEVMRYHLIKRILQLEDEMYTGDLGRLKVKSMPKWRNDLSSYEYDPQVKLQWGHGNNTTLQNATGTLTTDDENNIDSDGEVGDGDTDGEVRYTNKPFCDPGWKLGPSLEIDSEDSAEDTEMPMHESDELRTNVLQLASALLQVEQGIERRFLKEPFGVANETNKERAEQKLRGSIHRLKQWEISLMESTSYSQVFLHLNILHDCIIWSRSTNKSQCQVCRRGTDPEKMLLCDECNGGTHMFCMKPKIRTVPDGNWYCQRCIKRLGLKNNTEEDNKKQETQKRKRKFIVEEEEPVNDNMQTEDDHEKEETPDNESEVASSTVSSKTKARRSSGRRSGRRLQSKEIEEALESSIDDDDANADDDDDEEIQKTNNDEAAENENEELGNDEDDEEDADDDEEDEEEDEDEENESSVEEDESVGNVCLVCSYDGSDLTCVRCKVSYHLECVNLKRQPRHDYICHACKINENKKSKARLHNETEDDDDDSNEPLGKRSRVSRSSLRNSLTNGNDNSRNNNNINSNNNNNHRRSNRRTNENLPLNSSALYELLETTMKHKLAWPFLRPVTQSEVPDYHKIIKTPMDLSKVKSKLNMGKYQLNEEVLNDIQLIFRNCHEYNEENNEIYEAGSTLERFVMERCKDLHLSFRPSEMNAADAAATTSTSTTTTTTTS